MKQKHFLLLFITTFLISLLITGCNTYSAPTGKVNNDGDMGKLNIVVSILPQADLVKMVGGDKIEVTVMIPPGASPDSYEPSTSQLKSLSNADIYIMIGHLPFEEAWADRLLSANQELLVVDGAKGIEIIDHDPHIWLSPRLAKIQLQTIYEILVEVDAANANYYQANLKQGEAKLGIIDEKIKNIFADINNKTFLVYHPAWGYLAADYDLVEMAIEEQGKEPGPAQMAKITTKAKNLGINTVFTSSQHSTRSAEAIAEELGAKVVTLDPLPSNYEDVINSAKLISEALK